MKNSWSKVEKPNSSTEKYPLPGANNLFAFPGEIPRTRFPPEDLNMTMAAETEAVQFTRCRVQQEVAWESGAVLW